jgi:hypothetical protein
MHLYLGNEQFGITVQGALFRRGILIFRNF